MPGIYDRIRPEGPTGDGTDRVITHDMESVINAYYFHQVDPTRGLTRSAIVAILNKPLTVKLTPDERADLDIMADTVDQLFGRTLEVGTPPETALVNQAAAYVGNLVWLTRQVARGDVSEAEFRSQANLPAV